MGRPPLDRKASNTVRVLLTVSKKTRTRIKTVLAEGEKESDFIREAVETLLRKRERK